MDLFELSSDVSQPLLRLTLGRFRAQVAQTLDRLARPVEGWARGVRVIKRGIANPEGRAGSDQVSCDQRPEHLVDLVGDRSPEQIDDDSQSRVLPEVVESLLPSRIVERWATDVLPSLAVDLHELQR